MVTQDIDWPDILPPGARGVAAVYKHRRLIQKLWKKFLAEKNWGQTQIVVTGRPGVGKTVLRDRLLDLAAKLDWQPPKESTGTEPGAIPVGDSHKLLRVIPGQAVLNRDLGMSEAFSEHGGLEGIIHVVDWGFTMVRSSAVRDKMIEEDKVDTLEKLRKLNLEEELADFKLICDRARESVRTHRRKLWLMIAVTKADLYWSDIKQPQRYYHPKLDSRFTRILNEVRGSGVDIRSDAAPVCGVRNSFTWHTDTCRPQLAEDAQIGTLLVAFVEALTRLSNS